MRRARAFVTSVGLLVSGCAEPPLRPRAPTPGVPHFRITTFNVNLDMAGDAETLAAVGAADADIICLQETNADWEAAVRGAYGTRYPHMRFQHDGEGAGGLAVLSRFPLRDEGAVPGFRGWHPSWHLTADTPMGPVRLLLVHLRPRVSKKHGYVNAYLTADRDHAQEIAYIERHCSDDLPTLIVGDFNEDEDGGAAEYLEDRGFESVLPLFHPGQETWYYPSLLDQAGDTLDHIFFGPHFRPLDAYVIRRGRSDHLPVTAFFEKRSE